MGLTPDGYSIQVAGSAHSDSTAKVSASKATEKPATKCLHLYFSALNLLDEIERIPYEFLTPSLYSLLSKAAAKESIFTDALTVWE